MTWSSTDEGNGKRTHPKWPSWIVVALSAVVGGCIHTPSQFTGCVTFEGSPAGTQYHFTDTFNDSGVMLAVEAFQWGNAVWTTGNRAMFDNRGMAGGSGQDMNSNNVNLRFHFGEQGVNGLSIAFGEYGGNLNIQVNGEFRNFGNFANIAGATIGGTTVSVQNGTGNDKGTLKLSGKIVTFAVGGQELWVDDVCAL